MASGNAEENAEARCSLCHKANVTRTLQYIEIPRKHLGKVVTVCFNELTNPESPIAVRVFSMYVLAKIAKHEPGIINELRVTIEQLFPHAGAGLRACRKKVLKQIDKM